MPPLTIATFNINGINTRLPNLLEWLDREQPDVVCLQELEATEREFPAKALRDAGYDRWVRDRPKASDHAPTWIKLRSAAKTASRARRA